MQISTQTNQNIRNLQQTIFNTNDELQKNNENLIQLWIMAKETLEKAKENERRLNQLEETKDQIKLDMKTELMNNLKECIKQSIKTSDLIGKMETLQKENEDLQNILMRSTLFFCGVPELKKNDSWEEVSQNLVSLLAAKLNLAHKELNMQISHAHWTLKSEDNSNC